VIRVNVGCGQHRAEGWTNVDLHRDGPQPDQIGSVTSLPFATGCVDRVYCGHVLEHVAPDDLADAVAEIRRVLADDGELVIVGPDMNLTAEHEPGMLAVAVGGTRRWPGDEHQWAATGEMTLAFLAPCFDAQLVRIDELHPEWPVVDRIVLWQFAIHAVPKEAA